MQNKTIERHMKLSQQQRQSHIDLTTACYGHVIQKGKRKGQTSDHPKYAKESLITFHQIEDFNGRKINTCHLCFNNSKAPNGFVCINPAHMYFGSVKENHKDLDPYGNPTGASTPSSAKQKAAVAKTGKLPATDKQRKASAKSMSKISKKLLKEGRHNTQQIYTCPHCGKEGKGRSMLRCHFDNCRDK
jgi:hypothetical protein